MELSRLVLIVVISAFIIVSCIAGYAVVNFFKAMEVQGVVSND